MGIAAIVIARTEVTDPNVNTRLVGEASIRVCPSSRDARFPRSLRLGWARSPDLRSRPRTPRQGNQTPRHTKPMPRELGAHAFYTGQGYAATGVRFGKRRSSLNQ